MYHTNTANCLVSMLRKVCRMFFFLHCVLISTGGVSACAVTFFAKDAMGALIPELKFLEHKSFLGCKDGIPSDGFEALVQGRNKSRLCMLGLSWRSGKNHRTPSDRRLLKPHIMWKASIETFR